MSGKKNKLKRKFLPKKKEKYTNTTFKAEIVGRDASLDAAMYAVRTKYNELKRENEK